MKPASRKGFLRLVSVSVALLVSSQASAEYVSEYNKTVDHLGVQQDGSSEEVYFNVDEGFSRTCQYGLIFASITTSAGKASYATLLAARTSGRKLSRIDYSQPSVGGKCTLAIVELQD